MSRLASFKTMTTDPTSSLAPDQQVNKDKISQPINVYFFYKKGLNTIFLSIKFHFFKYLFKQEHFHLILSNKNNSFHIHQV